MPRAAAASIQGIPHSISSGLPHLRPVLVLYVLMTGSLAMGQVAGQELQSSDSASSIKGTVVNSITRAPISRALVFSPDNRFATLTDGEGHFEFALPKEQSSNGGGMTFYTAGTQSRSLVRDGMVFQLLARKPGFLDDPRDQAPIDTSSSTSDITIPLTPEGLIKGRVTRSDSDPALGITVQLFSRSVQEGIPKWIRSNATRANSNGEFRFAELQPGAYKVATDESMDNDPATTAPGGQLYGFPPVYFPGVPDQASASTIQLTAGQTVQLDIPLTRQPYYPVKIPVPDGDQNGGLNITVSMLGLSGGAQYSLGYNPEKQAIEGMLPNGNYLVEAMSFGSNGVAGSTHLSVAGAPAEGSSLALTPGSSITLHVTEQFTSPESDNSIFKFGTGGKTFRIHGPRTYLQLSVDSADDLRQVGAGLRPPTGPNDETLVLDNVPPGRYWLRASSSRGYVSAATMGGVDLLRQPFLVTPGSSTPIEITMRDDTAELEGTVSGVGTSSAMGDASAPRQQSWVYCVPLPDSSGQYQQALVGPDGKFIAAAMAPGAYRLLAFKKMQMNLPYRDAEAMRPYESKGQVVHLEAGQKATVQLQIISDSE